MAARHLRRRLSPDPIHLLQCRTHPSCRASGGAAALKMDMQCCALLCHRSLRLVVPSLRAMKCLGAVVTLQH